MCEVVQLSLDYSENKKLLESFEVLPSQITLHFAQAKSRQSICSASFGKFTVICIFAIIMLSAVSEYL